MGKLVKYKQLAQENLKKDHQKQNWLDIIELPYGNTSRSRGSFVIITYYYPRAECKLQAKGQSPYQIVAKAEFR